MRPWKVARDLSDPEFKQQLLGWGLPALLFEQKQTWALFEPKVRPAPRMPSVSHTRVRLPAEKGAPHMTVSVQRKELTCVERSTRVACLWCTILSRRLSSESHTSVRLQLMKEPLTRLYRVP